MTAYSMRWIRWFRRARHVSNFRTDSLNDSGDSVGVTGELSLVVINLCFSRLSLPLGARFTENDRCD